MNEVLLKTAVDTYMGPNPSKEFNASYLADWITLAQEIFSAREKNISWDLISSEIKDEIRDARTSKHYSYLSIMIVRFATTKLIKKLKKIE